MVVAAIIVPMALVAALTVAIATAAAVAVVLVVETLAVQLRQWWW